MKASYLLLFATAMVISALLTPLLRLLALRTKKLLQLPRPISIGTHVHPIPAGGGLAIYLGVLGALWSTRPWSGTEQRVILAGAVLVLFGILDDSRRISVSFKLVGQLLAAYLLLLVPGLGDKLAVPQLFDSTLINQVIAILWIVGVINAVNFLDIMDGLAAGTSAIVAFGFFLLAGFVSKGHTFAALAIGLAGSSVGFLIYNFEPASIFMGDTGSQVIGVVLGTMALLVAFSSSSIMILPPIVLLGVPLFEIAFTTTIRALTGKAPWKGSKDHFPLRMFRLGFSVRQIVLASYAVGLLFIICAIWLTRASTLGRLIVLLFLALSAIGAGLWLSQVEVPKASPRTKE